ncbi:DUF262 domain-containing HNH endonuclease family protein [Xanthomonas nasturtii]|uniref:DUF262 domain-containing protein n=1 Tax=Xanthomonas TaxID=338 RepID=UPI002B238D6B|nr:DUF262 domain-containing HNH endonuclease family protein [Xanthomonas nasturtii]MEA9557609.1 DUF262 domain-containing HNH endonuclease family protein [Xanthomonas nasturtii]
MQANPRTIPFLFGSQLRYVVPMFQRKYVWQESPQWQTLWEDISEKALLRLVGKEQRPHYLGALIIEGVKPESPQEVKRFLVIDGQQRITTLQLLLCAFRDYARQQEWRAIEMPLTRFVENPDREVMEKPDEEVHKVWPTTMNREVFRSVMTAGSCAEVEKRQPLQYLPRKRKPEPRSALVEAYLYFAKQIQTWIESTASRSDKDPVARAFALLQCLQEDFCVVEIALSDGDDSQEIFYSLNSQGSPLSQSDLLRSLIFMRAEKEKQNRDDIFNDYWSRFETPFWSYESSRGGRTFSRLDLGLRFFLIAKTGASVDARRVNEEYRRWVQGVPPKYATVREELSDFAKHSQVYEHYTLSPSTALSSTDFRRVVNDLDVSTALPLIMFLEAEAGLDAAQKTACLAALESYIVRRYFTGEENKEYNKLFADLVFHLRNKSGNEIMPLLSNRLLAGAGTTRVWPSNDEMIDAAINRNVYNNLSRPGLRLLLERVELRLRTKKSEETDIASNLQIEHILPQLWMTHWPLEGKQVPNMMAMYPHTVNEEFQPLQDAIRRRNAALQTIGNLTLLNQYLNPAASNGGFDSKLNEYRNSVLRLNRYFADLASWDEAAIAKRSQSIGEALCAIWPRPESTTASGSPVAV